MLRTLSLLLAIVFSTPVLAQERPWGVWFAGGAGLPSQTYKFPSYTLEIGATYGTFHGILPALVLKYTSLSHEDSVHFPGTGYTETRLYDVSAYSLGGRLLFPVDTAWSLFLDLESAFLSSKLSSISTTAPIPPELKAGHTVETGPVLAYNIGARYSRVSPKYFWGGSLSYAAIQANEPLGEVRILLHLGFQGPSLETAKSEATPHD